jgi:hypothetical protein
LRRIRPYEGITIKIEYGKIDDQTQNEEKITMSRSITLFSEWHSTMVSSWTTEIICKAAKGGACVLKTNVQSPDPVEDDYFDYCSDPLKPKEDFISAWNECCELMSVDVEIDDEVISNLETICPTVANQFRGD